MVNANMKSKFLEDMTNKGPKEIQKKIDEPNINIKVNTNIRSRGRKKLVNFNLTDEQQEIFNQTALKKGFVRIVNGQQVVNGSEFMRWLIDNKVWEEK